MSFSVGRYALGDLEHEECFTVFLSIDFSVVFNVRQLN